MNTNKSGWINQAAVRFRSEVMMMAGGAKAPKLTTWRSYKFGPTYKEGLDWRACCPKCFGQGELDPDATFVREDVRGRGHICFACQGRGWFSLPSPTIYKEFLVVWGMDKVSQGKVNEVERVFQSEVLYVNSLVEKGETEENLQWELEVLPFWAWALRRCEKVKEGEPFFTSPVPQKLQKAYERVIARAILNSPAENTEPPQNGMNEEGGEVTSQEPNLEPSYNQQYSNEYYQELAEAAAERQINNELMVDKLARLLGLS